MSLGGIIGAAVIPTATAAAGIWRPSQIARQLSGAARGLYWPGPVDANFSSVSFLTHFEEFQASTGGSPYPKLTDKSSKGHHLLACAYAAANTSQFGHVSPSSKFGFQCMVNSNNAAALCYGFGTTAADFAMGTGDFTIECWFSLGATGAYQTIFDLRPSNTVTNGPMFEVSNTNVLGMRHSGGSLDITGGTTLSVDGLWHHVHLTRASGTSYMGLDGAQEGSDYTDGNNYSSASLFIGSNTGPPSTGTSAFVGRIDEARVTKGVARYARTYTVPTAPFPDY